MSDQFMQAIEGGSAINLDEVLSQEEQASVKAATISKPSKKGKSAEAPADKAVAAKAPRAPKQPEGPNPWGIHNDRGEVITTSYLRKYMQCSCRGETYSLNRAANMAYLTSNEFLTQHAGISAGEYGRICSKYEGWFDETHPAPVAKPRTPKAAPVATGAIAAAQAADIAAAVAGEAEVLGEVK